MTRGKDTPTEEANEAPIDDAETSETAQVLDDKLTALIEDTTDEPDASTEYHEHEGGFAYMVPHKGEDGEVEYVPKRFTNFVAEIEEVRLIDSDFINSHGIAETERILILRGRLDTGRELGRTAMRSKEFFAKHALQANWPGTQLDVRTKKAEEHLRAAIIERSEPLHFRTVRRHTGWAHISGKWTYLHKGGGIDANGLNSGVETSLPDRLRQVDLPAPIETGPDLQGDAKAVLRLLDVAPDRVIVPLVAAVHRAILGSQLPITFSIFLAGLTGVLKSSLADLVQSFWGPDFMGQRPENWSSTANRIEKMTFEAKDALLLIDDYKPGTTARERNEMREKAHRVFQNAGNRVGRGRDTASGEDRPTRYPRALPLATGEEAPKSESTIARTLLIPLESGDVDTVVLTEAQEAAASGVYARYLSSYIHSVAKQYTAQKPILKKSYNALLIEARKQNLSHARLPDTVASLALGWEQFADFIEGAGALTPAEVHELRQRGWAALVEAATLQGRAQRQEQPAVIFMTYLRSAIASGRAHVSNSEGNAPHFSSRWGWRRDPRTDEFDDVHHAKGEWVGWVTPRKPDLVYLDPTATYSVVERIARDRGDVFPVAQAALQAALDDAGLLAKKSKGNRTTTSRYCGQNKRVLCLRVDNFDAEPSESNANQPRKRGRPCQRQEPSQE